MRLSYLCCEQASSNTSNVYEGLLQGAWWHGRVFVSGFFFFVLQEIQGSSCGIMDHWHTFWRNCGNFREFVSWLAFRYRFCIQCYFSGFGSSFVDPGLDQHFRHNSFEKMAALFDGFFESIPVCIHMDLLHRHLWRLRLASARIIYVWRYDDIAAPLVDLVACGYTKTRFLIAEISLRFSFCFRNCLPWLCDYCAFLCTVDIIMKGNWYTDLCWIRFQPMKSTWSR